MPTYSNDGLKLHYIERGTGSPLLLLHGFGMSAQSCWHDTGIVDVLADSGHRVLALDARGHGESDKPHDPDAYQVDRMRSDVLALVEQAGIERPAFVGHSMGGRMALNILADRGADAGPSVIVSNGSNVFQPSNTDAMAQAFESGDTSSLPPPVAHFVEMITAMGGDRLAYAAYLRNPPPPLAVAQLARVAVPIQIVCGEGDPVVGDPEQLRAAIPGAALCIVGGSEHTNLLTSQKLHDTMVEWLRTG